MKDQGSRGKGQGEKTQGSGKPKYSKARLAHLNKEGRARMVDVTEKEVTQREAVANARVRMRPETLKLIKEGAIKKGDVLAVAQVAGIMAAKKTPEFIPMCHPLQITGVDINFKIDEKKAEIEIEAVVKATDKTGVEMEALTAVTTAALTIYDMCKAVDRGMELVDIKLMKKSGGKSGTFVRKD